MDHADKTFLYNQYWNKKKSGNEIAKMCKCDPKTILYWLKKFNIPIRTKSEAQKINQNKPDVRKKKSNSLKGRIITGDWKIKMSKAHKNKKLSENHRKRISKSLIGHDVSQKLMEKMTGQNNHNWVGNTVCYGALHTWVRRWKQKTGICTICNEYKKTEWSNMDHQYRRNLDDYWELCHECHMLYDKLNFKNKNIKIGD